uniref:Putative ubiquitin-like-specific protease 2A n=1 Tax=Anthurium amnicola TaxID=1678845 RepID=A0A1D1XNJ9_9ARAE
MPRPPDMGWQYGEMIGGRNHVKCNYCHEIFHGGITLFKKHFIKGERGCASAPEEVREVIREGFSALPRKRGVDMAFIREHNVCNRGIRKMMTRQAMTELRTSGNVPTESVSDYIPPCPPTKLRVGKGKRTDSEKQVGQRSSEKDPIQSFYVSKLPLYMQAKKLRGIKERYTNSTERKKLDTNVFQSYLEYLWSRIFDQKIEFYAYLDCLWFSLYKKGPSQTKVLTWIKKKQIFSRKYVFVPIICWRHWSLLILCHFGESFQSKTKRPCMLLLDSLGKIDPMRLEPDIRRFVLDIYKSEGFEGKEDYISEIPLLVPKVPQQRNGEECGIFVLYFIYLFLQRAPEAFSQEDYPSFLTESWFSWEDMENFYMQVLRFASVKDSTRLDDGDVN